jgi:hypothetical protein
MRLAELFVQQKQKKDHSKNRTAFERYSDAYKALALVLCHVKKQGYL